MKKGFLILIVTLFVVSCTPATPVPTNTPQPSLTATIAPTPTPLPLSEISLEPIIIEEGDLPAGFSGAQIRDVAPGMFGDLPPAQNTVYQQLEKDGEEAGGIAIFLYDSQEDIEEAYDLIVDSMTVPDTPDDGIATELEQSKRVGEQTVTLSMSVSVLGITQEFVDMAFVRCNAVVHVRMAGTSNADSVIAYGKRLDSRIELLVCH